MAHKGKRYKLWVRRDLATTVLNYNDAYPEAYILGFTGVSSAFFQLERINGGLIYNTRKDSSIRRLWLGNDTTGPGIQLRTSVEVTDDPPGLPVKFTWTVFVGQIFRILEVQCETTPETSGYESFHNNTVPTVTIQDSRIDIDMINFRCGCTAARYDRYDP